ncbi:MAG TPA: RNA 2',3'-cyclic phosphodiesterase [Anaerolineales bacterium]|nr:RNA 2',3'-cyclic phosphodiesterase [Anaerolineales bacterium]
MSVFRAFIAVDLSAEVLDRLGQVMDGLRQEIGDGAVRWVPIENMHLTLKFLGDVSVSNLDRLKEIMRTSAVTCSPFALSVGGLGAFPSPLRARVVWVGVEGPPDLMGLQRMIDTETDRLGYASENRDFKPHLTLGRVGRNVTSKELQKIGQVLKEKKVGFLGVSQIREVHLFRSDLQPNGAVYTRMYSVSLAEKK